jgi:hypothetical protein
MTEGGDLGSDLLPVDFSADKDHAKVGTYGVSFGKERLDDVRRRAGSDVDVLGNKPEKEVPDRASREESGVACPAEGLRDVEGGDVCGAVVHDSTLGERYANAPPVLLPPRLVWVPVWRQAYAFSPVPAVVRRQRAEGEGWTAVYEAVPAGRESAVPG